MAHELRMDRQTAIVTGAGSGMGRAHCLLLGRRGASVVVNEMRGAIGKAELVCDEIRKSGGTAIAAEGTIGNDDDCVAIVRSAIEAFGRVDILVNNAGTSGIDTPVEDCPNKEVDDELRIHVAGSMQMFRAVWPHMKHQSYGRVLNTGSMACLGWEGPKGWNGAYSTAKAAVFGMTRQMAGAGAPFDIKVNVLLPRAHTPMTFVGLAETEFLEWRRTRLSADQVAAGILYLLHRDCPTSGQYFSSAGGRVARLMFASPVGYFNPRLTPEDVRDNWATVCGSVDSDGYISDMFEVTGERRDFKLLEQLLP
jgi:NAD(P)-dependent dehydrogenase (short-subunit alcohol dehydrogenase family)